MNQEPDPWRTGGQAQEPPATGTGRTGSMPPADVREAFNGTLMPRDPAELLGTRLDGFALNFVQPLPESLASCSEQLRADTYQQLHQNLTQAPGARLNSLNVDYSDEKVRHEEPRRYIRVQMRTLRDTQVTTLFRCYAAGPYLYMATDSYRLGRLGISSLVFRILITLVLFLWALPTALFTFGGSLVLFALFLWWAWGTVLRGAMSGRIDDALRTAFPRAVKDSSFDVDDILIYLKTLLPSITAAFRESCAQHGVDMTTVDEAILDLNKKVLSAEPSMIIKNYGSIAGSIFGGARNTVQGR